MTCFPVGDAVAQTWATLPARSSHLPCGSDRPVVCDRERRLLPAGEAHYANGYVSLPDPRGSICAGHLPALAAGLARRPCPSD